MRSKCVPGFVWFTESTLGGIHVRMNAPPPPFFLNFIKKRSITHLRWLLYLSSVNLIPLALVFVCFSTHQTHLGRWTKAEMAWLPLPPFLLTHKWKRSHVCFPWYDGVFSKCEKRKEKKGSFSTICILKKREIHNLDYCCVIVHCFPD